jgi:DNA repair protein RadC
MYVNRFAGAELHVYQELPNTEDLDTLLIEAGITNATQERMVVVAYDSIENIRTIQEIAKGGYHEVAVPIPPLLTAVLLAGVDRFLLVHNHPSGDTSPTNLDVDLAMKIMAAANTVGLYFEDNLIVGPDATTYSFLAAGLIIPAVQTLHMARGSGHQRAKTG